MSTRTQGCVSGRRGFLAGVATATAVVGFDPVRGRWISEAAASGCPGFAHAPHLDGALYFDTTHRQEVATDQGNIFEQAPIAVLAPGSTKDVRKMVKFCRLLGIRVAMRGQGHHMGGFALSPGLVVDSRSLAEIHSIDEVGRTADVDAGVTWKQLLEATVPLGLRPPVLTGYADLSVGGVLAMGGTSGAIAEGTKVEHVRELIVVTGKGDERRCSDSHRSDLFEVALGGLGQCALITRATIDLVPCEPNVRSYQLFYTDNAQYFSDLRILLAREEVPYMFTLLFPTPAGWLYVLNIGAFYYPDAPPDDAFLLRELSLPPEAAVVAEYDFLSYALLVDTQVEIFRQQLNWDELIKPWVVSLLPDSVAEEYVGETMAGLTEVDIGPGGFIILFSMRRDTMTRQLPRVPDADLGEWVHNFGILTSSATPGPDPEFVEQMLTRNLQLYDNAKDLGATRYPIGAVPFDQGDWEEHFGDFWPELEHRKNEFDPNGILTPGPGIFC